MIKSVGVNDYKIKLFEGQYKVENGMAYNSYAVFDEKIAIMDSVECNFREEWLNNIEKALGTKLPDYLVIQHMEPDHSACIKAFVEKYPNTILVGNDKTFKMINNFFQGLEYKGLVVKENDELSLGKDKLKFIFAPMVHWPEVMISYLVNEKVLFSADAFGKFGTTDTNEDWLEEARRYYIGIVGKFGQAVLNTFKKLASLDIQAIYPLHGPILDSNLGFYLEKYQTWASYQPEEKGVLIACASVYGNTMQAAIELKAKLEKNNVKTELYDLTTCDMSEVIAKAFMYDKLVIASISYNGGVFPCVETFINGLKSRLYQNRTVAIIENGSWAPCSKKTITTMLADCKNLKLLENFVSINSSLSAENHKQINNLTSELVAD